MVLTEEEKREHHRIANKKYRERLKKKAQSGDIKAVQFKEKTNKKRSFASAKAYIRNHATKKELSEIRDIIAERVKVLNEKTKLDSFYSLLEFLKK